MDNVKPFTYSTMSVGVFCDQVKPVNVNEYFQDVIDELMDLQLHGYYHGGSDNLRTAMRFESIPEKLSELPSFKATIRMEDHDRRVIKRVFRPDFTSDDMSVLIKMVFSVDIEYSPPPPPLQCMATAPNSTSLQKNVPSSAAALSPPGREHNS
ncbi:hypothetical protein EG68_10804 [Paragonimus skrjabini miyazakii]|uniref:Uncharacterized protein n=1 Tax=Paragonimus skrjabini miyazakii TaxID=59628 RepID=A0A8S9YJD3_9TREM|nr:hypothetical protein EG68_10804 [Paragonimus skrjabini miyazakii]